MFSLNNSPKTGVPHSYGTGVPHKGWTGVGHSYLGVVQRRCFYSKRSESLTFITRLSPMLSAVGSSPPCCASCPAKA